MFNVAWLESIGLLLVLVSGFFKLFLADELAGIHHGVLQFRVEEKIDYIFRLLAHHHRRAHPEDTKIFSSAMNLDGIDKNWVLADPKTRAGRQADAFRRVETYAFMIGSLLLVGAKLLPLIYPHAFTAGPVPPG